jgi:hypothetical protein
MTKTLVMNKLLRQKNKIGLSNEWPYEKYNQEQKIAAE